MLINKYPSRTFNDISQYPILPWIGQWGSDEAFDIISLRKKKSTFQANYDVELDQSKAEESKLDQDDDEANKIVETVDFMKKASEIWNLKLHSGRLIEAKDTALYNWYRDGMNLECKFIVNHHFI